MGTKELIQQAKDAAADGDRETQLSILAGLAAANDISPFLVRSLAWNFLARREYHAAALLALMVPLLDPAGQPADARLREQISHHVEIDLTNVIGALRGAAAGDGDRSTEPSYAVPEPLVASCLLALDPAALRDAIVELRQRGTPRQELIRLIDGLSRSCQQAHQYAALKELASLAVEWFGAPRHLRWAAVALLELREDAALERLIAQIPPNAARPAADDVFFANVGKHLAAKEQIRATLARIGDAAGAQPPPPPAELRALYVVHNSLPYASGGYATRTHGVARTIARQGLGSDVLARPGFPPDGGATENAAATIDGITYDFVATSTKSRFDYGYMWESAGAIAGHAAARSATLLHAASNYLVGLSTALAARQLHLPFVYEVRGFWELTRGVREPGYEHSPAGKRYALIEQIVGAAANAIVTLNRPMWDRLVQDGAAAEKIFVVPNCVDLAAFRPGQPTRRAALGIADGEVVIGYIGSFVAYEGLEDLILAFALLREKNLPVRLVLVGDDQPLGIAYRTAFGAELRRLAAAIGCADRIIFTGRVPFSETSSYYDAIDICAVPRRPFEVCQIVSPIKALEAMAMAKPLVVSDVAGMADLVNKQTRSLNFPAGDVAALARVLERLVVDRPERVRLGKAARKWVAKERSWDRQGPIIEAAYRFAAEHAPPDRAMLPRLLDRLFNSSPGATSPMLTPRQRAVLP